MAEDLPDGWKINEEVPDDWRAYLQQQSKNAEFYFSKESKQRADKIVQTIKRYMTALTVDELREKKFKFRSDYQINEETSEMVLNMLQDHNVYATYNWIDQVFKIKWD